MCSTQIDRPNSLDFTEIFVTLKRTSLLQQKKVDTVKKILKTVSRFYGPLWSNAVKLFTAVNHKCPFQARVFVTGNNLPPSLMFLSKAGAYLSEAPFNGSTLGWAPGLTPHKLD
jgi:hypothetical protein